MWSTTHYTKHRNTGRVPKVTIKFQENVVPPLTYFFKNHILLMAGVWPTWYTRCAVPQTVTERDTNHIQELDPGVSKRGLFKEYAYINGYKIWRQPKETSLKFFMIIISTIK